VKSRKKGLVTWASSLILRFCPVGSSKSLITWWTNKAEEEGLINSDHQEQLQEYTKSIYFKISMDSRNEMMLLEIIEFKKLNNKAELTSLRLIGWFTYSGAIVKIFRKIIHFFNHFWRIMQSPVKENYFVLSTCITQPMIQSKHSMVDLIIQCLTYLHLSFQTNYAKKKRQFKT